MANLIETSGLPFVSLTRWNSTESSSGSKSNANRRRPESCHAHILHLPVYYAMHTRVGGYFFGPFAGSHREPHQNRLKLICNLQRVCLVLATSVQTDQLERRGGGGISSCYHVSAPSLPLWQTQGPENWNTYQMRKKICNYNARYIVRLLSKIH